MTAESTCPHCKRIAIVKISEGQARYFGGCRHVVQIEECGGKVRVVYAEAQREL